MLISYDDILTSAEINICKGINRTVNIDSRVLRTISNVESGMTEEIAFTYHILYILRMHIICTKVLSDNEWTG